MHVHAIVEVSFAVSNRECRYPLPKMSFPVSGMCVLFSQKRTNEFSTIYSPKACVPKCVTGTLNRDDEKIEEPEHHVPSKWRRTRSGFWHPMTVALATRICGSHSQLLSSWMSSCFTSTCWCPVGKVHSDTRSARRPRRPGMRCARRALPMQPW